MTVCEQWDLVYADFASEYGVRLEQGMGWREFRRLLIGLLAADTRVWRFFTSKDNDDSVGVTSGG